MNVAKELNKIELLDVYSGLEESGKISKTVRLYFQPETKTFSEEEINALLGNVMQVLKKEFKVVVRV